MRNKKHILLLASILLPMHTSVFAEKLNLDFAEIKVNPTKTYSLGGQLTLKDSVEGGKPYFRILVLDILGVLGMMIGTQEHGRHN